MSQIRAEEQLIENIKENGPFHAYIFEGIGDDYMRTFVQTFTQIITPYKEDVTIVTSDGKSVKDEAVLYVQNRLSVKPYVGDWNVAIIENAGSMTIRAQNRLLKTLEEPEGDSVIILITENAERLLPTIQSRCLTYPINKEGLTVKHIEPMAQKQAKVIGTKIIEGQHYYSLCPTIKEIVDNKDSVYAFLDALEIWCRDLIFYTLGISEHKKHFNFDQIRHKVEIEHIYKMVKLIEQARRDLATNVNVSYTIKYILLEMMQRDTLEKKTNHRN